MKWKLVGCMTQPKTPGSSQAAIYRLLVGGKTDAYYKDAYLLQVRKDGHIDGEDIWETVTQADSKDGEFYTTLSLLADTLLRLAGEQSS